MQRRQQCAHRRRRRRHSIASAPWPTAGSMTSIGAGSRSPRPLSPSRSSPHSASTSASTSPASSLPQPGVRHCRGSARSRGRADAAAAAPGGAARRCRFSRPFGSAASPAPSRDTSTSRGSSRGSTQAIVEPRREARLHVLQRMHRQVDPPVEQRLLDLLGEQALAADLGEQAVLHPVAGGADGDELDRSRLGELGMWPRSAGRAPGWPGTAPSGCRGCRCAREDRHESSLR